MNVDLEWCKSHVFWYDYSDWGCIVKHSTCIWFSTRYGSGTNQHQNSIWFVLFVLLWITDLSHICAKIYIFKKNWATLFFAWLVVLESISETELLSILWSCCDLSGSSYSFIPLCRKILKSKCRISICRVVPLCTFCISCKQTSVWETDKEPLTFVHIVLHLCCMIYDPGGGKTGVNIWKAIFLVIIFLYP